MKVDVFFLFLVFLLVYYRSLSRFLLVFLLRTLYKVVVGLFCFKDYKVLVVFSFKESL